MAIMVGNRLGVGKERYTNCFQFFFAAFWSVLLLLFLQIQKQYIIVISLSSSIFFPPQLWFDYYSQQQQQKKTTTTNSSCCPLADGGHSSRSMYSSNTQEVSNTSMANRYKKIKEKFQKEKIKSCHQCCTAAGHRMVGFVRTHTHIFCFGSIVCVPTQKKVWFWCLRLCKTRSIFLASCHNVESHSHTYLPRRHKVTRDNDWSVTL